MQIVSKETEAVLFIVGVVALFLVGAWLEAFGTTPCWPLLVVWIVGMAISDLFYRNAD